MPLDRGVRQGPAAEVTPGRPSRGGGQATQTRGITSHRHYKLLCLRGCQPGVISLPRDIWPNLETYLVVMTWGGGAMGFQWLGTKGLLNILWHTGHAPA